MHPFIIKTTPNAGKGLFTTIPLDPGTVLFRLDGRTYSLAEVLKLPNNERTLQIGADLYLEFNDHYGVYVNHHCSSNCIVRIAANKAFLVANRPIQAGEELTFDYSLTSTETSDTWSMKCACGEFACRKVISGFSSLPDKIKAGYIENGIVPDYVLSK